MAAAPPQFTVEPPLLPLFPFCKSLLLFVSEQWPLLLFVVPLFKGPRDVMSGEDEVESLDDFDFEEDLEAVRLQVFI